MLNKKMSFKRVVIAGLVATTVLATGGVQVLAADETIGNATDGTKATSYGRVELLEGDSTEIPGIITPPGEPEDPDIQPPTGNTGLLTVDGISKLDFGTLKLSGGSEEISVKNGSAAISNKKVQVTDRRGTGAGWTLKVSASAFVDKDDSTKVLKGAEIDFPAGVAINSGDNISAAPTVFASTLPMDGGAPQSFMAASVGTGSGSWMNLMDSSDVKLKIPAGNLKGDYKATLSWVLEATPAP